MSGTGLAPYASAPERSRGCRHPEPAVPGQTVFQRDRDRVVHSTAFRRLAYKTQVFLNHEGDLFRTRITHSLEVAQLARSIARSLRLNEDLCEVISLAHDLGHTPFGHAGQHALDDCVREADPSSLGFEHNAQSLRVVDHLEERCLTHDGLNLSFEAREGILKHCSLRHAQALEAAEPGGVALRFIQRTRPGLEAQLCNVADELAYNAHDIDDGVRAGLLEYAQLLELPFFERFHRQVLAEHPQADGRRLLFEVIRRMLSYQVDDLISASNDRMARHELRDATDVARAPTLVACGDEVSAHSVQLKAFLRHQLYQHPRVVAANDVVRQVLRDLFQAYVDAPEQMPPSHAARVPRQLAITDYIAGMTDRFALREHARLFGDQLTSQLPRQLLPF
ncbi:MAG: deoxyguanosinetriphosphate triphosphohydrolase [Burkholderiales bacterium PBB1]|nr:MAG: deoxyguanosinetriphosphate triphosphohydrolase [Burkholderiales bacterium PBB1]